MYLHPKLIRPIAMVYVLSNFKNSGDKCNEVKSPVPGFQV